MSKNTTNDAMMAMMQEMMAKMMNEMVNSNSQEKPKASTKTSKESKYYNGDHFTVFKTKTGYEVEKHAGKYGNDEQRHDRNTELKGMIKMFGGEWCGDVDDGVYRWRMPDKASTDDFVEHAKKYDEMCLAKRSSNQ